ncbi:MAG: hypothetical protein HYR64_04810 [Fimbriimonas ginsengisoli]|uniref:Uncharacterized protein n=1 Tax=Fimbriimonas ginsengisoli TaxID=1005039 RepID=A0A931LVE1_FIMGI|nr:hypothetical protein [Fimbriimonas ginsengisoli]
MIDNTVGPMIEVGRLLKCKKEGWIYRVVEHLPAVEGLYLERYRLEIADPRAVRSCTLQDVIARAYVLERYRVVKLARRAA